MAMMEQRVAGDEVSQGGKARLCRIRYAMDRNLEQILNGKKRSLYRLISYLEKYWS